MKNEPLRNKELKLPEGLKISPEGFSFFAKKDIVSACKFYKKYHNNYDLFTSNFPELITGKMYLWLNSHNFDNDDDRNNEFNCFLFDYTFGDVTE